MSRVITFSRFFQKGHPKAGQPTWFVEQIWNSFRDESWTLPKDYTPFVQNVMSLTNTTYYVLAMGIRGIKGHTIRAGNRWKVGDKFSPRVWSGKPYASKQITIAPDIEIKNIWQIKIRGNRTWINGKLFSQRRFSNQMASMARNDGLETQHFWDWFNIKPGTSFTGSIICWDEKINYL